MPDSSNNSSSNAVVSSHNNNSDSNEMDKTSQYAKIDLGDITPHNLKLLKKVNQVVFPVVYHDKFYKDVLEVRDFFFIFLTRKILDQAMVLFLPIFETLPVLLKNLFC
jgi:hypothetical protein